MKKHIIVSDTDDPNRKKIEVIFGHCHSDIIKKQLHFHGSIFTCTQILDDFKDEVNEEVHSSFKTRITKFSEEKLHHEVSHIAQELERKESKIQRELVSEVGLDLF